MIFPLTTQDRKHHLFLLSKHALALLSLILIKYHSNLVLAFGNKKSQMIFITIRDGYVDPVGIDKMAKDFQGIMSTGGI